MSQKVKDNKNRWRNKTVAFRVSPEEWEQFETVVRLTGLSKQDYLISKIYERDIIVNGNSRVHKAVREELAKVLTRLEKLDIEPFDEFLETIKLIAIIVDGIDKEKSKETDKVTKSN